MITEEARQIVWNSMRPQVVGVFQYLDHGVVTENIARTLADRDVRLARLVEALEGLHGLVESTALGWSGALPHGDNVSTLVLQDRLTVEDVKRKADAILRAALADAGAKQ